MTNTLNLTVLVENTAQGHGLLAEQGLAFWIELGSRRILFDAGQTDIVCHNADLLGIGFCSADAIVLSHGHYDHTGGLAAVLKDTSGVGGSSVVAAAVADHAVSFALVLLSRACTRYVYWVSGCRSVSS